jgi:hypothetical protein
MEEIVIHPIYALQPDWFEIPPFDESILPLQLPEEVALEDVSSFFDKDAFTHMKGHMSDRDIKTLSSVKYALVRRFQRENDAIVVVAGRRKPLIEPVEALMACLRIIRPMRERLGLMRGFVRSDGSFDIRSFHSPYDVSEVPEVEKLFAVRTDDALLLKEIARTFLKAMSGEYWKVRMAVDFFQAGFFQTLYPKARFLLRCSAIDAIYSSQELTNSNTQKSRIKRFLGSRICIYEPGDIPQSLPQAPDITIKRVIEPIYQVRNCIAHGDRIPQKFLSETWRPGLNGSLNAMSVLDEAVSMISRKSLLKILQQNLIEHFKSSETADSFFAPPTAKPSASSTPSLP